LKRGWFPVIFPALIGACLWAGLALRDPRGSWHLLVPCCLTSSPRTTTRSSNAIHDDGEVGRESGAAPKALMDGIMRLGMEAAQAGVSGRKGGLAPNALGGRVVLPIGELTSFDGPFAEAKEVIGATLCMRFFFFFFFLFFFCWFFFFFVLKSREEGDVLGAGALHGSPSWTSAGDWSPRSGKSARSSDPPPGLPHAPA
jgi:hypothetical protein